MQDRERERKKKGGLEPPESKQKQRRWERKKANEQKERSSEGRDAESSTFSAAAWPTAVSS